MSDHTDHNGFNGVTIMKFILLGYLLEVTGLVWKVSIAFPKEKTVIIIYAPRVDMK